MVEFEPIHALTMDLKDDTDLLDLPKSERADRLEVMKDSSIDSATWFYEGAPLFCAGYAPLRDGVVFCWMLSSKNLGRATFTVARTLKKYMDDIISHDLCHRIETTTPADAFHSRFLEFLGMKREGLLKQYTSRRRDRYMYARVK